MAETFELAASEGCVIIGVDIAATVEFVDIGKSVVLGAVVETVEFVILVATVDVKEIGGETVALVLVPENGILEEFVVETVEFIVVKGVVAETVEFIVVEGVAAEIVELILLEVAV